MSRLTLFLNIDTPELIILFIISIPFVLMVYALIDIVRSDFKDTTHKLLWILIVVLAPLIGSIVYLLWRKSHSI